MEYKQRIIIAVEKGMIRTHLPADKERDNQAVNYYLGGKNE